MKLTKSERILAAEALLVAAWSPKLALNKPQQRLIVSCIERLTGPLEDPVYGRNARRFLAKTIRGFWASVHEQAAKDFPTRWSRWRSPLRRKQYRTYQRRCAAVEKFLEEVCKEKAG